MLLVNIREATKHDYAFLAQLTGHPVTRWLEWDRQHFIFVATIRQQIAGVLVVGFDSEESTFQIHHLEVMRFYRRNRIARQLWGLAIGELPPTNYVANVADEFTDVQCTLRAFGFRCVGRNGDGSMRFVRT